MTNCESCGGSHDVRDGLCETCRADVRAAQRFEWRTGGAGGAVIVVFVALPVVAGLVVLLDWLFGS